MEKKKGKNKGETSLRSLGMKGMTVNDYGHDDNKKGVKQGPFHKFN